MKKKKSPKQKNVESQTFPSKSLQSGCCLKGGREIAFSGLSPGLVLIILTIKLK